MTELPESVDLQWIGGMVLASQRDIRDVRNDRQAMREDQRACATKSTSW